MSSSPLQSTAVSAMPVEAGSSVNRSDWKDIPPGMTIEVISVRGNKRNGIFRGMSDKGLFLIAEAGKSQLSHLVPDQLESVKTFGMAETVPSAASPLTSTHVLDSPSETNRVAQAIPGTVISIEDLKQLPEQSRVELTSVRGNPRTGIFCGLKPNGDISFIPDIDKQPAVYPRSQLFSVRVLANGVEQVNLQSEFLAELRREFQTAAIGFATHVGEMRGVLIVDATSGRIVEVKKSGATECDTLSWDESGILRPNFAEFTVMVNLNNGTFEARASTMTQADPLAIATVRQCLADYALELLRNHPSR